MNEVAVNNLIARHALRTLDDVTAASRRITLRRVRVGDVRRLLGGGIVDCGRAVPDYVTDALRELVDKDHVRAVECATGELTFEITPTGQALYDDLLRHPRAAVEPGTPPPARLRRTPLPPEKRWPQLAFLLDANPPWTFTTLDSGIVTGRTQDGDSLWVVSERSAGYVSRRQRWSEPECTFRGPLHRLVMFLGPTEQCRTEQ